MNFCPKCCRPDPVCKSGTACSAVQAAVNAANAVGPDLPKAGAVVTLNPKDKLGLKKVNLSLVPPISVAYQALAMTDGARKYGPFNWRENQVLASIYIAAAQRHIDSWRDGENEASDSKVHHLGHALACLGIIVDAQETGNLIDDRPKAGAASKLIAKWEKKPI